MEDYMKKIEVLKDTGLSAIPDEYRGSKVWFRAIGEVMLKNGTKTYAIVERTGMDSHRIKRIYGEISPIHKLEKIFPYEFIDKISTPQFAPNDKQNRLFYLRERFGEEKAKEYSDMTASQLSDVIRRIGIEDAIIEKRGIGKEASND